MLIQGNLDLFRATRHTHYGFVAAAGPSIQGGALGDIQVLDLAPTFLYLMGEPILQALTGHVIKAIISDSVSGSNGA